MIFFQTKQIFGRGKLHDDVVNGVESHNHSDENNPVIVRQCGRPFGLLPGFGPHKLFSCGLS